MSQSGEHKTSSRSVSARSVLIAVAAIAAIASVVAAALLVTIFERKSEARNPDDRLVNMGLFEAVYFNGKFQGWKAHMVDTQFDNENYIFNFSKIDKYNKVQEFIITYTESGFGVDPKQKPRVENAVATRIHKH